MIIAYLKYFIFSIEIRYKYHQEYGDLSHSIILLFTSFKNLKKKDQNKINFNPFHFHINKKQLLIKTFL